MDMGLESKIRGDFSGQVVPVYLGFPLFFEVFIGLRKVSGPEKASGSGQRRRMDTLEDQVLLEVDSTPFLMSICPPQEEDHAMDMRVEP